MRRISLHIVAYLFGGAMALTACGDNSRECGLGTELVNGVCQGAQCGAGTVADATGVCRPDGSIVCTDGTVFDNGVCLPDISSCGAGLVLYEGACIDPAMVDPDYAAEGAIELAAEGEQVTVHGCIDPAGGVVDYNMYSFTASGPTLLDVTVDGYNGMSGAFVMDTMVDALLANDWVRFGLNLTNDMAKRQVFLPAAGDYMITVMDSRSLLNGFPVGDGNTCYLATIATLPMPVPTPIAGLAEGSLKGEAAFYEYIAVEADIVFTQADSMNNTVLIDAVIMNNGQYFDSASGNFDVRPLGSGATSQISNLAQDEQVVVVVDPVMDYGVDDAAYSLLVNSARPQPLPETDTITVEDNGFGIRYLFFDVIAGDVVHLRFASDAPGGLIATVTDVDLGTITSGCNPCSSYDDFIYFSESGRYNLTLQDLSDPQPPSFQLTVDRLHHTPRALAGVGTSLTGEALNVDGNSFYTMDWNAIDWVVYTGASEADFLGDLEMSFYARRGAGALGKEVGTFHSFTLGEDMEAGHIYDAGDKYLIRARDDGFVSGTPGTYGFDVNQRVYTDLGTADGMTPIDMIDIPMEADGFARYLVRAPVFSEVDLSVGDSVNAFDAQVLVYDKIETETTFDSGWGGEPEVFSVTAAPSGFVAFGVKEFFGDPGVFEIHIDSNLPPMLVTPNAVEFETVCPWEGGVGQQVTELIGDDDDGLNAEPFILQFPFDLLGTPVSIFSTWTNGFITFQNPPPLFQFWQNDPIPSASEPNGLISPLWTDLQFVRMCYYDGPTEFVMQWEGVRWGGEEPARIQVVMHDDSSIDFIYAGNHGLSSGLATVGLENMNGDGGFAMGNNVEGLANGGTSWTLSPF